MQDYRNPNLKIDTSKIEPGSIRWRSPSNLAIVKYWGKYGQQLPRNPSISFTLDTAATDTRLLYEAAKGPEGKLELYFEGKRNESFEKKVNGFFNKIGAIFPFIRQMDFRIETANSFPHSAGIASSASGMSALTLCLCSLEKQLFGSLESSAAFLQKASFVSRLGSGSASRSVYPSMAIWGENEQRSEDSNLYATPFTEELHPVFRSFHDDILIVHKGQKSVSSTAGHALMEGNIYAANRYEQARTNFANLLDILKSGDVKAFGEIAESEALTLHALMMTSTPSYILMQPNSLKLIQMVRTFRQDTGCPLYFSLDAGPNLHLLYPDENKDQVRQFIGDQLAAYCIDGSWISDRVGAGPEELT